MLLLLLSAFLFRFLLEEAKQKIKSTTEMSNLTLMADMDGAKFSTNLKTRGVDLLAGPICELLQQN